MATLTPIHSRNTTSQCAYYTRKVEILFTVQIYTSVYRSNVLALYSFYPPEPKCITQNKTQRSQINLAKEPNLAPEPRSGQHWYIQILWKYLSTRYSPETILLYKAQRAMPFKSHRKLCLRYYDKLIRNIHYVHDS